MGGLIEVRAERQLGRAKLVPAWALLHVAAKVP